MGFNTHSELGSKGRIDILWTFFRKEYTIQHCIIPQICTAWLQTEIASQCACAHVHASNLRRTHFCCTRAASPQIHLVLGLHPAVWLPLHRGSNKSVTTQDTASASDKKKEETKEPPLLVSPICGISDPSHTIRPGEGSLYTVLLMLCSHNLHASATFSNTRSVKKSLTGFLICATWDAATSSCFSSHKQESFWVLRSSDNKTSRSLWYFIFYASGWIRLISI